MELGQFEKVVEIGPADIIVDGQYSGYKPEIIRNHKRDSANMIVVLNGEANRKIGETISSNLRDGFKGHVEVSLTSASSPSAWPTEVNWDDLLIVVFDGAHFPDAGNDFISEYLQKHKKTALLLPVALDVGHRKPPRAAEAIKALEFDATAAGVDGRLVKRVGAMLGLRVQQRDTQVFISYRASDGTDVAKQLEARLASLGYPVWRDEAREMDGETQILPGSDVQQQIDQGLERASIVLLLDTPAAPHSVWIKHEVDTANGLLLPVLPLCFRSQNDPKRGPRFNSLLQLQRWVALPFPGPPPVPPLTEDELNLVVSEMETYLCEIFQRKCRVPFIVEKEFISRDYSWRILDQRLLMCESLKKHSLRLTTKVLSHCSIFDQVHGPALQMFREFLKNTGRPNHSLFIYDGELIPEPQLKDVIEAAPRDDGVVILHHQELAALIDSNFTNLAL